MNQRPDSDSQGCGLWTEGRPGDGVMVMRLRAWVPPMTYRVEDGRPGRTQGAHLHRFTTLADVPRLRAMDATSPCYGDGHYECRRCIFFRPDEARW